MSYYFLGHVEEHSMSEHDFRAQYRAHSILGSGTGPSWEGTTELPEGAGDIQDDEEDDDDDEEAEKEAQVLRKAAKAKRSAHNQETSIFHGKSLADYQGRTYMHPPLAVAPHITSEAGHQETFIPKACVHTFTGHTQGVSVIRLFPQTGHLLLSGSMDTKIKVNTYVYLFTAITISTVNPALGRLPRWQLPSHIHGSSQGGQRCHLLQRRAQILKLWL